MTKNFLVTALLLLPFIYNSQAQVIKKIVDNFNSLKNVTYISTVREKDLFSDKIYNDTLNSYFVLSKNKEAFKITRIKTQEVYDGKKLTKMDFNTLTYRIENSTNNSILQNNSLPYIISELRKDIKNNSLIKLKRDSIVDGKKYFHLGITSRDTVIKNERVYIIKELLIDKKNYLPIYYRYEQQGFIDGTDMLVNVYSELHFYNYQLNRKKIVDLSEFVVPSKYSIEKPKESKPLLAKGSKAPELNLTDTNGNLFQLKSLKGKVALLNFTTNGCPHCIESISMLNNLYSIYEKENFNIVTINPFDDQESIEIYNKKRNIKYPIFINSGTNNTDNYNVEGYPTFYLIDKNGNIVKGVSGYDKSLDDELNNLIKEHL